MSIMSPEALVTLLAAYPYPGCIVTRPGGAVRLDFDGLALIYKADGWHFGGTHLESTLSDYSAPEQVHPEIRRILKVVMSLKVERALSEADAAVEPYLTNLCAEKMLAILDVAALANAHKAKIASNVAEAAARDMRIADLEATIEATHKVLDGAGVTWSLGNEATRLPLAKRAEFAAEPDTLTNTEREALTERATKAEAEVARMRGGDRDLAAKDKSLKTAHAALAQVSDLLGSPPPVVPDDAVEAVKMHLARRPQPAPVVLTDIAQALADAGAPQAYHLEDDTERPIPDPERIRLLGERIHTLRAQVREAADATNYLDALIEAHNALDVLKAPRLADGCVLSLAARIRALSR